MSRRGNGEGSIYPVAGGYRAFVWVTTPEGVRKRKYVKRKTYEETRQAWRELKAQVDKGPVAVNAPTLAVFLLYWLREVVEPNLAPSTYARYETFVRLYITPGLGHRRVDKLTVKHVREWLNALRRTCQCCTQGKDAARSEPRCCALGKCCQSVPAERTIKDIRDTLRAALSIAITEEIISKNVASAVRLPTPRKHKRKWWSVEEARQFLEAARQVRDPLFVIYILILVLGLRRGEALGLTWDDVDLDTGEITIVWQLQRVGRQLHHRETKTPGSSAILPIPDVCVQALKERAEQQAADKKAAGDAWVSSDLVVTTKHGTPYEPRNFNRHFHAACQHAGVRLIKVHDTRRTCASLLVALEVHPRVAMQILRHSKIAVTMDIYSEVPTEATRNALRRLGDSLDR
ncbi:tyrosine-type recombinase/integrase [Nonomuraea angiospora]|uniref:Integrase n=1 Tax=Nonomuraea angiospora TaxID=46172 RepID=A0ABR9LXT9_9ACTN|nr:site-specific integrase [Nonomuraea angiospora]MBE1585088.1 integrase [Nonomuraea angiospora]